MQADGSEITTVQGLADGELHPVQKAFRENHALRCGYCTAGMIMSVVDLLMDNPDPSDEQVRDGLEGNLCRCTGYHNIVRAVRAAAAELRTGQAAPAAGLRMTWQAAATAACFSIPGTGPVRRYCMAGNLRQSRWSRRRTKTRCLLYLPRARTRSAAGQLRRP
jgi:xanthine dehydrogenase iron-sulfur cluster and FAD-binding subunit A